MSSLVSFVRSFLLYLKDKPVTHDTWVNSICSLNYATSPKHVDFVKWRWLGNDRCLFRRLYKRHEDAVGQSEEFFVLKKVCFVPLEFKVVNCSNLTTCVSGLLLRSLTFTVPNVMYASVAKVISHCTFSYWNFILNSYLSHGHPVGCTFPI